MSEEFHQTTGDGGINVGKARDVRITQHIQQAVPLPPPRQLPAPPADFTGRQAELAALLDARKRGATISGLRGLGGVGKTTLALRLAQQIAADYPDAQLFIDLMGTSAEPLPAAQAMRQVIHAWYPEVKLPENEAELGAMYRSVLSGKKVLLLLDNARSKEQVEPLLPPAGCYALVTSRWQFTLPGLHACDLDALPPDDAIQLLLSIAPRLKEQAAGLAELCGCLPLALRLSASALAERPSLPVDEFLAKLQAARLEMIGAEAAIRLSYDLLSAEMQSRLASLGVFPAPFDRAAAAAVWGVEAPAAQEILDGLLSFSLVAWDAESKRFRLHDLLRDFAWGRLDQAEQELAGYRHAEYYRHVLAAADDLYLQGGDGVLDGLGLLDQEWEHMRTGQAWAAAGAKRNDAAARLCNEYPDAGVYVLGLRLHPRRWISWLKDALEAARRLGLRQAEGVYLGNLGLAFVDLGESRMAIEYSEMALTIAREVGDRRNEGAWLSNLGIAYANLGELHRAIEFYEQDLAITRQIGDRRGEGANLCNLGNAYAVLGDTRRAIEFHEQGLAITREIGDRSGEGIALNNLGLAYADLGETRRAIEFYEQALLIAREIGNRGGEGNALGNLGLAYADLGETRRAIEFYEQQLVITREIGDRLGESNTLGNLGLAYADLGETCQAINLHEQRLVIACEIGNRSGEGKAHWGLAICAEKAGRIEDAVAHAQAALEIFVAIESPDMESMRQLLKKWQESP